MFAVSRVVVKHDMSLLLKHGRLCSRSYGLARINGENCTALVLGGFGFKERQMQKHATLYEKFDFNVVPILSSVRELTTPLIGEKRAPKIAEQLQAINQPMVIHAISGSVWTMFYILQYMDKEWRDKNVKAIVFDSCPPKSDVYAFGGWLAFMLKRNYLRPYLAPLFHPYIWYAGITEEWREENHAKMFGPLSVIPRDANILFIHGKNDPVLDNGYVAEFIADVKAHRSRNASVCQKVFPKSRHAMSVIDYPEEYKIVHVAQLLSKVPDWTEIYSEADEDQQRAGEMG